VLPPSWTQVLEKIEQSLEETVRQVAAREQAPAPPADGLRWGEWQAALGRLDGRLAALAEGVARAEREAAAADAALADAADGLGRWLREAGEAARTLADRGGRAVS
jgi:hypothetical protein